MTIQTILAQYPKVEKAFIEQKEHQDEVVRFNHKDKSLSIDEYVSFNTLKGHIEAFFRGHGIAINVYYQPYVDWGHSVRHINNEDNYITIARDGEDDYETAFLSALEKAAEYLETKI